MRSPAFNESNKMAISIYFKSFISKELSTRKLSVMLREQVFKQLIELVLDKDVLSSRVVDQVIAPIENILFFDEADKISKLSDLIFQPITNGLVNKDPETL